MSFILDALRKSDQMRQGTPLPTLSALPIEAPARQTMPAGLILLTGFLLLGAGLFIGWWQPWASKHTSPATLPPVQSPLTNTALPQPTTLPAETAALPKKIPPASSRPATVIPARPLPVTEKTAKATETSPSPTLPTPAPAPETSPLTEYDQLPAALQAELPNLSVTAHAHSKNAKASYVFIKDRMLHEGDTLPPGLTLEKITAKGMIFSYKGQRFHRGLHP